MTTSERLCQHCGNEIPANKRRDAKFCSPKCVERKRVRVRTEAIRNSNREWARRNPEIGKAWRAANPEKVTAARKTYYRKNRDQIIEASRLRELENPEASRLRHMNKSRRYREQLAIEAIDLMNDIKEKAS